MPELGEGAYVVKMSVLRATIGHQVVAKHANGRVVTTELMDPLGERTPTEEAAVEWHKVVAAAL